MLRILLSIGPTEAMHFQIWHDMAGDAPPLTDPTNGLTFPDLNAPPFGGEDFETNLIMPEPTRFLRRRGFPAVSIVRPTETKGAAMGAVKALTADGLFIGQSTAFFKVLHDLAAAADKAGMGTELSPSRGGGHRLCQTRRQPGDQRRVAVRNAAVASFEQLEAMLDARLVEAAVQCSRSPRRG